MSPVATDHLSVVFGALADPTRRAILARRELVRRVLEGAGYEVLATGLPSEAERLLADGEATVNQLAEPFDMTLPAISKHLKVLERAGLISRGREAQWRPCRLEAESLREASDWVDRYRTFWESNFDRLDAHLKRIQPAANPAGATKPVNPTHRTAKPAAGEKE